MLLFKVTLGTFKLNGSGTLLNKKYTSIMVYSHANMLSICDSVNMVIYYSLNVQLRLMGLSLALHIFGQKPKYQTNKYCDLMMEKN